MQRLWKKYAGTCTLFRVFLLYIVYQPVFWEFSVYVNTVMLIFFAINSWKMVWFSVVFLFDVMSAFSLNFSSLLFRRLHDRGRFRPQDSRHNKQLWRSVWKLSWAEASVYHRKAFHDCEPHQVSCRRRCYILTKVYREFFALIHVRLGSVLP